jgi:hypothetical protein
MWLLINLRLRTYQQKCLNNYNRNVEIMINELNTTEIFLV